MKTNLPCGCIRADDKWAHICEEHARAVAEQKARSESASKMTLADRVADLERAVFGRSAPSTN
jgi:hypothetical protein